MTADSNEQEQLRRRMKRLRKAIVAQADDVVSEARRITDWRHHYGKMPWAWMSAAAAVGFLVVPRKKEPPVKLTPEQVAEVAKANVEMAFDRPPRPSIARVLAGHLGKTALNAAVKFATDRISAAGEQRPTPAEDESRTT